MVFTQLHIRMPPLQGHTDIWGGNVPARRASSPWLPLYTRAGTGALLAKADIKSAYRLVPVHPDDRMLLGVEWQGSHYIDGMLPFALAALHLRCSRQLPMPWSGVFGKEV